MVSASRQRGIILLSALWTIMLLSIIASTMVLVSRNRAETAGGLADRAKARAMTQAGLARGIIALLDRDPSSPWLIDNTPQTVILAGTSVTISIQDELGRIDLNAAPHDILVSLLNIVYDDAGEVASVADAIEDWRDRDDLRRPHGAEKSEYKEHGLLYDPRNGPFESVDELRQVLGVTDQKFRLLKSAMTVWSGKPYVDLLSARPAVKEQLGSRLPIDPNRSSGSRDSGFSNTSASLIDISGRAFTITASVSLRSGTEYTQTMAIRFTRDQAKPYWVLDVK